MALFRTRPVRAADAGWRERGATLVEAAIVTPVFFLLVFAVIEFGDAYKDKLALSNAVTAGARTGSAAADDSYADYNILQAVKKSLTGVRMSQIQSIVVFSAGNSNGVPTASCKTGSASPGSGAGPGVPRTDACNVYTVADLSLPKDKFGCLPGENLDRFYCPASRKVAISPGTGGPPDIVGVWIKMQHSYFTRFFGSSVTLTDQSVIGVEPRRL